MECTLMVLKEYGFFGLVDLCALCEQNLCEGPVGGSCEGMCSMRSESVQAVHVALQILIETQCQEAIRMLNVCCGCQILFPFMHGA